MHSLDLVQRVQVGTRNQALLDLILTTSKLKPLDLELNCPLGSSDHSVLQFCLEFKKPTRCLTVKKMYRTTDWDSFCSALTINWERELVHLNIKEAWEKFKHNLFKVESKLVATKKVIDKPGKPWWCVEISKLIKLKQLMWKSHSTNPSVIT